VDRTIIISNRLAGKGKDWRAIERLRDLLLDRGVSVETHVPESAENAREITRVAVSSGIGYVVISGGDGSLQNILDVVAGTDSALAALPAGRGNDFVRGLSMPRSIDGLALSILNRQFRTVDVGCVNNTFFGTIVSCGLDAEVGRLTAGGSAFGGMVGYLIQALKSIRSFEAYPVKVEVDGRVVADGEMTLVACANTPTYGGGFRVAPGASPTDGKLDICIVCRVSRIKALSLLHLMAIGQHPGHPEVTFLSGQEIRIETADPLIALADGEVIGQTPLEISVKRRSLRVVY